MGKMIDILRQVIIKSALLIVQSTGDMLSGAALKPGIKAQFQCTPLSPQYLLRSPVYSR
jgi:hypothetical protein